MLPKFTNWSFAGAAESVTVMFGTRVALPAPLTEKVMIEVRGSSLGILKVSDAAATETGVKRTVTAQLAAGASVRFGVQVLTGMVNGAASASATAIVPMRRGASPPLAMVTIWSAVVKVTVPKLKGDAGVAVIFRGLNSNAPMSQIAVTAGGKGFPSTGRVIPRASVAGQTVADPASIAGLVG
jgi:hypothetical protein